jgi:hypothetical protein
LKPKKPLSTKHSGEPEDGFVGLVKSSVNIEGIDFVGYCTADIIPEIKRVDVDCYKYAIQNNQFVDINDGVEHSRKAKHIGRLRRAIEEVTKGPNNRILVVMAHEGRDNLNAADITPAIKPVLEKAKTRLLVGGHSHGKSGPVPEFHESLWPIPLAGGAVIFKFLPYSIYPDHGTTQWCNFDQWSTPLPDIQYTNLGGVPNDGWQPFWSAAAG